MHSTRTLLPAPFIALALLMAPAATAQDAKPPTSDEKPKPTTTGNPRIALDDLELRIQPLRAEELLVEIEGWLGLVQKKAAEISAAELGVKRQNREIEARESAAEKAEDASEQLKEAQQALEKAKATNNQDDIETATKAVQAANEALRKAREAEEKAEKTREMEETSPPTQPGPSDDKKSTTQQIEDAVEKAKAAEAVRKAEEARAEAAKQPESTAQPTGTPPATALPAGETPNAEAQKQRAEQEAEVKSALLDQLATLRDERTALIARAELIVDRYEKLGGEAVTTEVAGYRSYLSGVSGAVTVDPTDLDATISNLVNWVKSPEGGVKWGINFCKFLGILVFFLILARVTGRMVQRAVGMARNISELLRSFVVSMVKRTILAVGLVVAVSALGVNVGPLLALIGAAGFVIAFALQGTLSNFASGLLILFYRPFDVGDVVEVSGVLGKVGAMNLMSTTLMTPDNKLVIVPNNSIWGNVITNVTGSATRRVDMVFGIGYGDDISKAQKILEEVTQTHELVLADPAPVIQVHELGDSSVNFVCRPWSKTGDYWTVYWDITRRVKERFDAEGVSIPFPQRDVHVYNEALPKKD